MHDTTTTQASAGSDLGSGTRFGADVYELYEAGRVAFPDLAASYGQAASELHYVAWALAGIAARLDCVGGWGVAHQAEQLYGVMAATSRRLHVTGEALILMADDLRRSDEAAAATFHRLVGEHRDLLTSAPSWTPPPPSADRPDLGPREQPDEDGLDGLLHGSGIAPLPGSGDGSGGGGGS